MNTKKAKKAKKEKEMVAIIFYRDGANYKNHFLVPVPKGSKIKVAKDEDDEIEVTQLGITQEQWEKDFLTQLCGGYDEEIDHNLVLVEEIRERKEGDILNSKL